VIHQVIHHALGVAENDAELEIVNVNQPREQLHLVAAVHLVINLFDGRHGHRLLLDLHVLRLARIFFDQVADRRGMVAEKKTVCRSFGASFKMVSMSSRKPMLSITSASSRMTILTVSEPQRAAPHVIHDAARRADDDLRALLQAPELALVGLAAVNRQRVMPRLKSASLWISSETWMASSRVGQRISTCTGAGGIHLFHGRECERRRLAGAGLRLADDVLARHQHGNGLGLDGRGLFEAQFINGLQDFGGQAEFGKIVLVSCKD
jgi:hypothetical protein